MVVRREADLAIRDENASEERNLRAILHEQLPHSGH